MLTPNKKHQTLVETLHPPMTSSDFYPGICVALVTLPKYPVSTCTAEYTFSVMKRLKTPLRSTITEEGLSGLPGNIILLIKKHKNIDMDNVGFEFYLLKERRLPFACQFNSAVSLSLNLLPIKR